MAYTFICNMVFNMKTTLAFLSQIILLCGWSAVSKAEDSKTVKSELEYLRESVVRLQGALGGYEDRFHKMESANRALWSTVLNQNQHMAHMEEAIQGLQQTVQRQELQLDNFPKALSDILVHISGYNDDVMNSPQNDMTGVNDQAKARGLMKRLLVGSLTVPVAFQAYLSSRQTTPNGHQTIIFDTVQLNVGNGYHPTSGIFVTPESGVYVFAWSIRLYGNSSHSAQLVVGDQEYDAVYLSVRNGDNENVSGTAVAQVEKGEDVFVRTHAAYNWGNVESDPVGRTSFCGWKIN